MWHSDVGRTIMIRDSSGATHEDTCPGAAGFGYRPVRVQPPRLRRAVERNISDREIREAGTHAEIVEEYPDDKYSPSALILGFTAAGSPLHIQVSLAEHKLTKIITIYRPEPEQWFEFRDRR